MTIIWKSGNIFEGLDARFLGIPVCCVPGVMGAGLAKQAVDFYGSGIRDEHRSWINEKKAAGITVTPGFTWSMGANELPPYLVGRGYPWPMFVATKGHWRDPSKIEWIKLACENIIRDQWMFGDKSKDVNFALPLLGAGLGGLTVDDVLYVMREAFESTEKVKVEIWLPDGINAPKSLAEQINDFYRDKVLW